MNTELKTELTQPVFTCSKREMETPRYLLVQSEKWKHQNDA